MLEAIWYGSVAALTFIGFVSLVYVAVLHIYRPKGNGNYILYIPESYSIDEVLNQIYGAHLRNLIYGGLICNDIIIVDNNLSEERKLLIKKISEDFSGVNFISLDDITAFFERKEENGTGIC